MPDLITKKEACDHLRFDYDEDSNGDYVTSAYDSWLSTWIPVVSEQVTLWVKEEARLYEPELDSSGGIVTDSSGEPVPAIPLSVRYVVRAACLVELASLNRYREGEGKDNVVPSDAGYGYSLNKTSTALLAPLRKPTAA